jgi:ATP-dependent RNA helicase RhlE
MDIWFLNKAMDLNITFEDLKLTRQFLNAIQDLGYTIPTTIQLKAIPLIRSGQHIIGIAQTGTGKTAAYLLPIMQLLKYAQGDLPRCVILVPTKELVLQVLEQVVLLGKYTDLRSVGLYGGVGRKKQASDAISGVDIVVSTPMRLLEIYQKEGLDLKKVQILVMDEADRMLDMGFRPQINAILDVLPRKKQNMMFSATFSSIIEELSWDFMDFPIKIEITPEATPVETVEQRAYLVPNFQTKLNLIEYLLKDISLNRVMIFVKSKGSANRIFEYLKHRIKGEIRLIHSNKSQNARINSFNDFREGNVRLLISTDVMSRGIDVSAVSHVINFDVPTVYEDYVHRIGRTGRALNEGIAVTFVSKADEYHLSKIEKKIRMPVPIFHLPDNLEITETPFEENQSMEKEIDEQKKKEDPNFQGAFHEKKDYKLKQKQKKAKKVPKFTGKSKSVVQKTVKTGLKTSKYNRNKEK